MEEATRPRRSSTSRSFFAGDRSATNAKNPSGFLRKVVSTSYTIDGLIIETSPALVSARVWALPVEIAADIAAANYGQGFAA